MKPNNHNSQNANSIRHVDTLWKQLMERQAQRQKRPVVGRTATEENDTPLSDFLETAIEMSTASLQEEARLRGANDSAIPTVEASQQQAETTMTSTTTTTTPTTIRRMESP
jgi:hypothetical protein